MLALHRKRGESLWIGNIEIRIVNIARGQARLAVTCPADHEILRGELIEKIPIPPDRYRVSVPRPAKASP